MTSARAGDQINIFVSPYVLRLCGAPSEAKRQVAAQVNLSYAVAAAIIRKDLFLEEFEEACLNDHVIKNHITKIRIECFSNVRESPTAGFELFPAEVQIRTVHGKVYSHRNESRNIKGGPDCPVDFDDCLERLRKCAKHSAAPIDGNRLSRVAAIIKDLDQLEDVQAIPSLLSLDTFGASRAEAPIARGEK